MFCLSVQLNEIEAAKAVIELSCVSTFFCLLLSFSNFSDQLTQNSSAAFVLCKSKRSLARKNYIHGMDALTLCYQLHTFSFFFFFFLIILLFIF